MFSTRTIPITFALMVLMGVAFLAYFLIEGGKEPSRDYSWALRDMEAATDSCLYGFLFAEPQRVHHIGDPITVRFGVVYCKDAWEVIPDAFESSIPIPPEFEVRERKTVTQDVDKFSVIETILIVQCLVCRDGTYSIGFEQSNMPYARSKEDGEVNVVQDYADSGRQKITFAPLTDAGYRATDPMVRIKAQGARLSTALFAVAGFCLAMAGALFLYWQWLLYRMRKGQGRGFQGTETQDYPWRIRVLRTRLTAANVADVANSFYALLLLTEYEGSIDVDATQDIRSIREELGAAIYGVEAAQSEDLQVVLLELMVRAEDCFAQQTSGKQSTAELRELGEV